jgi:selenide,water dikinase
MGPAATDVSDAEALAVMEVMATLNRGASEAMVETGVHAATDVTGFGLAGHALEMARGARCHVRLDWSAVPRLPAADAMAARGLVTGASGRNWAGYGQEVELPAGFAAADRALLTDPQTSGGLLVACTPDTVDQALAIFRAEGFESAALIGEVLGPDEAPRLKVT